MRRMETLFFFLTPILVKSFKVCAETKRNFFCVVHGTIRFYLSLHKKKSGTEGFEPPGNGTKTRCLTTWPRPISFYATLINTSVLIYYSSIPLQLPKK